MTLLLAERDRLLEGPRQVLARARRDPSAWPHTTYGLLLALQYDRRPDDLPLLRYVLRRQIAWYRETSRSYFPTVLFLAGLLVAEHRRVEDVWLHWEAKELSFDTALGYRIQLLLTPGVAAVREAATRASHDRLLKQLSGRPWTDAEVDTWLADQRRRFPDDPAAESLKTWSHHASALGDPEASRRFLLAWADGEPRTVEGLNTVQYHLASQGFWADAIAAQREAVALTEPGDVSFRLGVLAELHLEAGEVEEAWSALRSAAARLPAGRESSLPGLWCQVARGCFRVASLLPARAAFDLGEEVLRAGTAWWMNGAVDAALAAAERLEDQELLARARELRRIADEQAAASRYG